MYTMQKKMNKHMIPSKFKVYKILRRILQKKPKENENYSNNQNLSFYAFNDKRCCIATNWGSDIYTIY